MAGYSPGPYVTRAKFKEMFDISLPLDYAEAGEVFALARFPDRGKPVAGHETRLFQDERTGDYYLSYRDAPIVVYHSDGTVTLDHNGYPTKMTAQRMDEYAPLPRVIQLVGKRQSKWGDEGSYYAWDNLALSFDCPLRPAEVAQDLRYQWFPERFERRCLLPFVRGRLRVDGTGRPVLSSLLRDLAPPEWGYRLGAQIQPWTEAPKAFWTDVATAPLHHQRAYDALFPSDGGHDHLLLLRPTWVGSEVVATVWTHQVPTGPTLYRWLVRKRPGHLGDEFLSGQTSDLQLAVSDADKAIASADWHTTPPLLTEVLGNLREQIWSPRSGQLKIFAAPDLLQTPVLRVHWQEPWITYETAEGVKRRKTLPRDPLPGSKPWAGTEDVRVWFELVDGTAVGVVHDPKRNQDEVVVRRLHPEARTQWETPGILATGLLAGVLAALIGG